MAKTRKKSMEALYEQIRSGNIDTSKIDFSDIEEEDDNTLFNNAMQQVYSQIRSGNIDINKIDYFRNIDSYDNEEYNPNEIDSSKWFKKSKAFQDNEGTILSDTAKTVKGTLDDIGSHVAKGIMNMGEGIGDLITYGRAQYNENKGNIDKANELRSNAQQNTIDDLFSGNLRVKESKNAILNGIGTAFNKADERFRKYG